MHLAYVSGILLLSIISLNNPHQRRINNGHFSDVSSIFEIKNADQRQYFHDIFQFRILKNFEVYKHREFGILSRRPPLQWCQSLHFLTDTLEPITTTTTKAPESFPEQFLKKYEKYLRRDGEHSKPNNLDTPNKTNSSDKKAVAKRFSNAKQIYYERLWPKTKNLRKRPGSPTQPPETGLTALASFPVSSQRIHSRSFFLFLFPLRFSFFFVLLGRKK